MARWTTAFPSYSTLYSYVEVDNWETHGDRCTFDLSGGITSPYYWNVGGISCEIGWWESGTYHPIDTDTTSYNRNGGDVTVFDFSDYFTRQAADRTVYLYHEAQASGTAYAESSAYTVPHAAPAVTWASSNPVVRNSDNSITLTWNAPALEYSAMCLEVSTDGGAWSQFAVLWNTATSYEWTGCSADHSYQFRIRTNYLASYSAYDTCATVIYMTPAAPQSISTAAAGGTNITVNLVNPSPVATKVQYEVSTDDGATWGATQDSASLTSFSVSASGTVKIRVRNYNATGTSAWLTSDTVTTICPPAKPTITSPQTGAWDVSQPLDVAWLHNSLDGSAQEAYKLRVTKLTPPLASHTETYSPSTASTQSITWAQIQSWLPTLALGGKLGIGIATKGADASYSSFGTSAGIVPFTAPTLSITKPTATVTGMPIEFEATYSDMAGYTCQAATVSLQKDGRTLFSEPCEVNGSTITAQLDTSEFLPANGETYTVVLTARSSSSLQATANATFTTAFTEPQAGTLSITDDPETGYASLLATFDNHATDQPYSGATNEQFDTTAGYVRSLTVEGKSAKWNQIFPSNSSGRTDYGITMTNSGGGKYTFTGTSTTNSAMLGTQINTPIGHKFYYFGNSGGVKMGSQSSSDDDGRGNFWTNNTSSATRWFVFYVANGTTVNVTFTPAIIDLTAIYGAGNEPTALTDPRIEWLKAYALAHPTYDAGSLVSIEGAGVRGRNLCDNDAMVQGDLSLGNVTTGTNWISDYIPVEAGKTYIRSSDVDRTAGAENAFYNSSKTYLSRSFFDTFTVPSGAAYVRCEFYTSTKGKFQVEIGSTAHAYTPYITPTTITTPLRSAGSIADELQVQGTEAQVARKVGYVDLGSLTWSLMSGKTNTFNASLSSAAGAGGTDIAKCICPKYEAAAYSTAVTQGGYMAIASTTKNIYITDMSFTTAAAFKTAMSGVYLFYELATPTTDTLSDVPLIELGTAATVTTDLDSTFEMIGWDGSADAVSISVARVNADGITPLIEDAASGAGAVDKYAPLNTAYKYAVTTKSSANAVKTVYVDNEIVTDLWFAYWGDNIASAKWNPDNGGIQIARPQKTRVYYAGRKDPVSYDGAAVSLTETPSWMVVDRSEVQPFVQLIEDGGRGVYKSCDGWVYHADFDLTLTPKYTAIGYYGGVGLSVTRIAGEQL